ncbi:MAG: LysR family transcriptional regulator [Lachnospiraceae bacterium]|nr:LysR family transcriptional regulator [Lachnospiraceae bacterium]
MGSRKGKMNTKQLNYVLALARDKSFSQAAENLNISQPSLSQYIKKIEKEIGYELFDRTGSEVRLTEAGQIYLEAGKEILELERKMKNKFADLATYKCGNIVVGVSPHRSVSFMPRVVADFRRKYPGMQITLEERVGQELIEGAEKGEFDLCITTLPVDLKKFSYENIMREEIVLAVSSETELYRTISSLARQQDDTEYPVVDIKLLDGYDFIVLGETQLLYRVLEKLSEKEKIAFNKAVECRSVESQLAMVKEGVGVALVPSGMARFSGEKNIKYFSLKQKVLYRDVVVVYRKGQYLSRAVLDLKEIIKKL